MNLTELSPVPELPAHAERSRLRKRFGVTQTRLANELGVSRKTIIRWEAGESEPVGDNLNEYAAILSAWAETERQTET
jgi:DNA-binding XRE family transcriptional regulator